MTTTIDRSLHIPANPEQVWAALADFPSVHKWVPAITRSPQVGSKSRGVGAARACQIPGFGDIEETVEEWREGTGFTYRWQASGPVREGRSTWNLTPEGEGSRVQVLVRAEMRFGVLGQVLGRLVLVPRMNRLLDDALRGLHHHVLTGELVDEGGLGRSAAA